MATTRYPRLKLLISALSAASVIAGAAYFRSAQNVPSDTTAASGVAQSAVVTTAYQSGATGTNIAAVATRAANTTTTARTSRGS